MAKDMTKREMLEKVAQGEVTDEVMAKAEAMLAAMDAEAEKRKEKAAEKRAEKLESEKGLEDGIVKFLGTVESATASDIKDAVDGIESPQKATAVAKRLVEAGVLTVGDGKGKSGKVKIYSLVTEQSIMQSS